MTSHSVIKIDPEFKMLIPALMPDEYAQLEANILTDGCRDALVVWEPVERGDHIILDGHNRYAICQKHGRDFCTLRLESKDLPDRQAAINWIINNQLGRRNLHPDQASYLRGKRYNGEKQAHGGQEPGSRDQNDPSIRTADRLASEYKVSAPTIKRDGQFSQAIDQIAAAIEQPPLKIAPVIPKSVASDIAALMPDEQKQLIDASDKAAILQRAKEIRSEKARANQEDRDRLKKAALEIAPPTGKYRCIIIDPPWDMQKIEREVRPNQVGFDYPTMSEAELAAFDVPGMTADESHLFLWTTHKYLPMALRLTDAWGFKYIFTMVWHKPGGFQPIGLAQYNCEFILFGRKGGLDFLDTKAFPACFQAPRREHSRKPDEFYELVKRVSPEPRIDVFSREAREGFAQYGNETGKFSEVRS